MYGMCSVLYVGCVLCMYSLCILYVLYSLCGVFIVCGCGVYDLWYMSSVLCAHACV